MATKGDTFSPLLKRSFSENVEASCFTDEKHGSSILKGLFGLYKDGRYADISLKIGKERTLKAHRVVLASFSPYFEALLGNNWKEGKKEEIEILGLDESAVSDLIEFAYSGNINISRDNVQTLLEAANYLGIEFVKKSCGDFLKQGVDVKTCLGIWQLADVFALEGLSNEAKNYALRHFTQVCKEDEFLRLPIKLLTDLLSEEEIFIVVEDLIPCVEEREKIVLQAVLQYIEQDTENRKTHLTQLLHLVRLPTLSTEYLQEVSAHELIESKFDELLEKAKQLKVLPPENDMPDEKWAEPRKFAKYVFSWGRCFANGGQVQPEIAWCTNKEMFEDLENDHYVTGMELWIRQWDGRSVLGGLKIYYKDNSAMTFGHDSEGICAENTREDHEHREFHLEKNEKIVKVDVQSGWMIDCLTFYTNKKDEDGKQKCYGPYGGNGGSFSSELAPGSYGYLGGVAGAVVKSQGDAGITRLQFVWRSYVLPGDPVPLKRRCRVANSFDDDDDDEDDEYDFYEDAYDDYEDYEDGDDYDDYDEYDDFEDIFEFEMGAQPYMFEPLA